MGTVLVMRNPTGRPFSDVSSLTLVGGVAWGECFLQLSPLLMDDDDLIEQARGFGRRYVGASRQAIYNQYCRLDATFRLEIEGYAGAITKSVRGISFGISTGGPMGELAGTVTRSFRRGLIWLQRFLVQRFSRFVRERLLDLADDGVGLMAGNFTAGTSGGFFNMYDGGALHGIGEHSTLDLDITRLRRMNFLVVQLAGGVIVGAGINLLIIGDFPSITSILSRDGHESLPEIADNLMSYITGVFNNAYCWALIGDAAVGAILPGVDINLVGS